MSMSQNVPRDVVRDEPHGELRRALGTIVVRAQLDEEPVGG